MENDIEKVLSKVAVKKLRVDYENALKAQEQATSNVNSCIEAMQCWCEHPVESIRECLSNSGLLYDRPPMRVCIDCGYAEYGWYFQALKQDYSVKIEQILYEKLMELRIGVIHNS